MNSSEHRPKAGEAIRRANALEREAAVNRGNVFYALSNAHRREEAQKIREQVGTSVDLDELKQIGAGGELLTYDGPFKELGTPMEPNALPARLLRDTVKDPNLVTIDASRHRQELAAEAGVLEMSLDLSDTMGAENSLEKMLAQQLAANHRSIMKLSGIQNRLAESLQLGSSEQIAITYLQGVNVEMCRVANAIARQQSAFNEGLLAWQKLKSKGRQEMVVQHVYVNKGGQAIVAGQVKGGARKPRGSAKNER
jgi:hypothetical protein